MRKGILVLVVFVISSLALSSQVSENKITRSDFHHFADCQRIVTYKRKNGDSSFVDISYLFDKNGNLVRKYEGFPISGGESQHLTDYSYNEKGCLIKKTKYDTAYIKNVFSSFEERYFYNGKINPDSSVNSISYPYFDFIPVTEKSITENIKVFDEPILAPLDSTIRGGIMTMSVDGKAKYIKGYEKIKKEVVLQDVVTYTGAVFRYSYNSQNKLIKEELPKLIDNEFSGSSVFIYDKKGRISEEHFNYDQKGRQQYLDPIQDSAYKWEKNHYSSYFEFGKDNSITETAVFLNQTLKLICYRNKKGQVTQTICSSVWVENKYADGKFIPTDTIKIPASSNYEFSKQKYLYEYDSLGRIIKCVECFSSNEHGDILKFDISTLYRYNDNRLIKLPESEYVDSEIWYHHFLMFKQEFQLF